MISKLLLIVQFFFISTRAAAYDYGIIEDEFRSTFETHYQPTKCGPNIINFLRRLADKGFEMQRVSLVYITNKGFSVFGMVNAEHARGIRFGEPAVIESNWYHHVIAVDDRGYVFDFDFDIEPRIEKFSQYVEEMFLNEAECENPAYGKFCAGRLEKLKGYKLEWNQSVAIVEEDSKTSPVYWTSSLEEALKFFPTVAR